MAFYDDRREAKMKKEMKENRLLRWTKKENRLKIESKICYDYYYRENIEEKKIWEEQSPENKQTNKQNITELIHKIIIATLVRVPTVVFCKYGRE